jgi:molecular chaperone GrpE
LSQDPVDAPDGPMGDADETTEPPDAALELPPAAGAHEQLQRRARLAEDRLTEVLGAYRQVKAENEGFRERVTRDVERQFERHREKLLLKFIEILDNLDRALEAAEQTYAGNPLIEGLILVRTQLLQTLQQEGLERIPVLGLPYDPALSEAVSTQPVADPEHDHVVVRELMRGYRLHGRVARASRVVVGAYNADAVPSREALDDMIGADETDFATRLPREVDPAAETTPIDEKTLREIFGDPGRENGD